MLFLSAFCEQNAGSQATGGTQTAAAHGAGGLMAQLPDRRRTKRALASVGLAAVLVAGVVAPARANAEAAPADTDVAALTAGHTTVMTTATNVAARSDRRPVAGGVY